MQRQKPFAGMEFSATRVEESSLKTIKQIIESLGGTYTHNLLVSTESLVVGLRWTDKYDFCVANRSDVRFYSPEFITELHDRIIIGQKLDFRRELAEGRLRAFQDLIITFSGIKEHEKRVLERLVEGAGGKVDKRLANINVVVCPDPDSKNALLAAEFKLPVVHPDWVLDSITAGQAINPKLYLATLPAESRGLNHANKRRQDSQVPGSTGTGTAASAPSKSVVASTAHKAGPLAPKPRRAVADWGSMFGPAPTGSSVPIKAQALGTEVSLTRATSGGASATSGAGNASDSLTGMFAGLSFKLIGFDTRQVSILRKTLVSHDGLLTESPDYYVLNSEKPEDLSKLAAEPAVPVITEWAIERSLHLKSCKLNDVWSSVVRKQPLPLFKSLQICLSGYTGIEFLHLTRLIKLLGAEFLPSLTAARDLLISPSPAARKVDYAKNWGVPVVSHQWLWDCALEGRLIPIDHGYAMDSLGARQLRTEKAELENEAIHGAVPGYMSDDSRTASRGSLIETDVSNLSATSEVIYADDGTAERDRLLAALRGSTFKSLDRADQAETLPAVNVKRGRNRSA